MAIFQGGEAPDVENNLATLEKVVAAHKGKVDLFVFPELYLGGYVAASDFHKYAEQSDGPSFQRIAAAARENSVSAPKTFPNHLIKQPFRTTTSTLIN